MNRQEVFDWVNEQYGTTPDYPWGDDNAVLRHSTNNKWYAVILCVGSDKLGLDSHDVIDVLNVKCDPIMIGSYLGQNGFHPAYHMNKDKWISIRLDGSASQEDIKLLIDISYSLTMPKFRKNRSSKSSK